MDIVALQAAKADAKKNYAPLSVSLAGSPTIRNMAATPAYAATTMASPPTVTQNAAAGGSNTRWVQYTSSVFQWPGYVDTSGSSATPRHYTKADGSGRTSSVPSTRVAFDYDGQQFDFIIKALTGLKYRIWVNEQAATATLQAIPSVTGTTAYLNIDFGSASLGAPRRIIVEIESQANTIQFYGVQTTPTATVTAPALKSPRVILVGDSYGQGNGGTFYTYGYGRQLGRLLGWNDFWSEFTSVGSTGLVKTASAAIGNYQSRLAADVIPFAPEAVIIQGSLNDNPYAGLSQVGPALTTYVQTLLAALPKCKVVVTSPLYVAAPPASYTSVGTEMAATCAALGLPYIDMLTPAYFFGTGKAGATNNSGNSDNYLASDGTHPVDAGHNMLARYMAPLIARALGIPVTA